MKKFFVITALCCLSFSAFAQEEKPKLNKPLSEGIESIQTAATLAQYGYRTASPTSLIEAARIFGTVLVQEAEFEQIAREVTQDVTEKDGGISYDPDQLLADAREMAGKDKALLGLIKRTEKEIEEASHATRGVVGGAQYVEDVVYANSSVSYRVKCWGGEVTEVLLVGDHDTDLDLYIYDEDGNLITSDTDYTDVCVCRWIPAWTGYFVIKIVNRGDVYNAFALATN